MSEKKDVYSDVKSQMRLSERIAAAIPGFHGYKEKELRRESDRLIRNHLYQKLSNTKNNLKGSVQKLADRRYFDVMTDADRLLAKMDRVAEKVNHASYGYTGLFDAVKVKEEALDRMINFDTQLIDGANTIAAEVDAFKNDLANGETKNIKTRLQAITDKVESFEGTFDSRDEVIKGVN